MRSILARSVLPIALAAASGAPVMAQCPPTFTVSGPWPMGSPYNAAVGDFDRDGRLDLAAGNFSGTTMTVRFASIHQPPGTAYEPAQSYTLGFNPGYVATGDFNNDGTTDIALTQLNGGAARIAVFISNGNRTFQPPAFYTTTPGMAMYLRAADITRDGITDLIVSVPNGVAVLPGHAGAWASAGDVAFSKRLFGVMPNSFCLADLNSDGALDLAFPQVDPSAVRVTLGSPPASESFGTPVTYATGFFGAITPFPADFNNDGRADLVLSHYISGRAQVCLSNPNGSLTPQTAVFVGGQSPQHAAAADFNGDGMMDAVTANTTGGNITVLLGNGAGGLAMSANFAVTQPNGLAIADMNNDGKPDIVVSSAQSGGDTIFLNTTPVTVFDVAAQNARVCPGGQSNSSFTARATTTQTGGITGYRWERLVGGNWQQLNNGPLAGVGTISITGGTNGNATSLHVAQVQGNSGDTVMTLRAVALTSCGGNPGAPVTLSIIIPCGPADVGGTGGVYTGCGDGVLDNNDFVVFIDLFFNGNAVADMGSTGGQPGADGQLNNNDFVVFIDLFFAGCTE